ncbi:hypothetical protein Poli38472_006779 [Pythium oligandrum]|uniref:RING-type domain-containing protein n=1 Tax=Pythium oligandrum TaxID=41045 RepID=A0A8K1C573_PYTOL|nr:hypothetical protein Poli38472_006779 [Pythium oligandrum]|eukprot:TMW56769.1 hypothetical protein Poli38472_006779 [Pythium oligandrum]
MGNSPPKRASISRELDRFTHPTGLYPSCPWDFRSVRRMILEKKIAPRFPGRDSKESCFTQECPICFMYYPGSLNTATCCKKPICSECYLQLKPPRKSVCCPFCNREGFSIKYTAPAAINLSSIYTETTYNGNSSTAVEGSSSEASSTSTPTLQHLASVEDRQRIRDDLRSQLNLTDRPLSTPVERPSLSMYNRPPGAANFIISSPEDAALLAEPRFILASAADAARLEEMMLMEAIRRSMRDLNVAKDDDEANTENDGDEYGEDADEDGEGDTLRPSQVVVDEASRTRTSRQPSSNPFDEPPTGRPSPPSDQRDSASYNPFSD